MEKEHIDLVRLNVAQDISYVILWTENTKVRFTIADLNAVFHVSDGFELEQNTVLLLCSVII